MMLPTYYLCLKSDLTSLQDPSRDEERYAIGEYRTWTPNDPPLETDIVFIVHRGRANGKGPVPAEWHELPHVLDPITVSAHVDAQPAAWPLASAFAAALTNGNGKGHTFVSTAKLRDLKGNVTGDGPATFLTITPTDNTFQLVMKVHALAGGGDFKP